MDGIELAQNVPACWERDENPIMLEFASRLLHGRPTYP
jgi:hypothetical protein